MENSSTGDRVLGFLEEKLGLGVKFWRVLCLEERGFRDREEEWEAAAAESMTAQSSASSRSLSSTAEKGIEDAEEDAISEARVLREREGLLGPGVF